MAASQSVKKNPFADIGAAKAKLKKTRNIKDKSGPKLTGFISKEEVAEYDKACFLNSLIANNVQFPKYMYLCKYSI